jgi:hypothetical protein
MDDPGDYRVIVTCPNGDTVDWAGYADNVSDALFHVINDREAGAA